MSVSTEVTKKLTAIQDLTTIAVRLKAEHYFDTLRAILDNYSGKKGLEVIYITLTIPSQSIINALTALEVSMDHVHFVDAISNVMMTPGPKTDRIVNVESPTMLEYIMLKIEYLMRKTKEKRNLVLLDSINSLSIHNNPKILSEFLHLLSNHVRAKEGYFFILSMEEYENDDVRSILSLVCEDRFTVGEVIE